MVTAAQMASAIEDGTLVHPFSFFRFVHIRVSSPFVFCIFFIMIEFAYTASAMDLEKGPSTPELSLNPLYELSPSPSPTALASAPALVLSNSGKRIDQAGKKKYVKQVTGKHNDTELHLAAQRGDLAAVKQILNDIDSQMIGTLSGCDLETEVAEVRASLVNEVNELGETVLFTAAEKGHLDVLKELLKYSNKESVSRKNRCGFDPLHIAASEGHQGDIPSFICICLFGDAALIACFLNNPIPSFSFKIYLLIRLV